MTPFSPILHLPPLSPISNTPVAVVQLKECSALVAAAVAVAESSSEARKVGDV